MPGRGRCYRHYWPWIFRPSNSVYPLWLRPLIAVDACDFPPFQSKQADFLVGRCHKQEERARSCRGRRFRVFGRHGKGTHFSATRGQGSVGEELTTDFSDGHGCSRRRAMLGQAKLALCFQIPSQASLHGILKPHHSFCCANSPALAPCSEIFRKKHWGCAWPPSGDVL